MSYPVFLNLCDKKVLVVGGGRIAERKIQHLLGECSQIVVVSGSFTKNIEKYASAHNNIVLIRRYFQEHDIDDVFIVFITTHDQSVNNDVAKLCIQKNILFNHAADVKQGSIRNGAILRRGDLNILIGTGGNRPAVSKWLKTVFADAIPKNIDNIMHEYDDLRRFARDTFDKSIDRENFIKKEFKKMIGEKRL